MQKRLWEKVGKVVSGECKICNDIAIRDLIDNDFIVSDEATVENINKELFMAPSELENSFHLILDTGYRCNFDCLYCYQRSYADNSLARYNVNEVIPHILKLLQKRDLETLHLEYIGGEPTLNARLYWIVLV